MRIAIDCRPLMSGKISGVEVYMLNMFRALFEADQKNEYVLWYNNFRSVDTSGWPTVYPNVVLMRTRIPNKILNLSLSMLRWPKINHLIARHGGQGGKVDVLWVPDPRPAPVSETCKKVVTFHDLSFEDFKYSFTFKTRLWHKILRPKLEAREADHLIAVSHFTKNQLVEEYGIDPAKITIIHEAAAPHLKPLDMPRSFEIIQRKYKLPGQYFLCLSTLEPRKNIKGVIDAYLDWQREVKHPVALVIAGRKYPEIFAENPLVRHPGILFTGFIDEEDKALVYEHALAFLYPSFYEGFGLPILEAMACGAPVITSDTAAMPEVAGNAAHFVNPSDSHQLKDALHQIYRDDIYRTQLIERGFKRAAEFSWKKAVIELTEVLCN